jgi:hypothetical protein
MAAKKAKKKVAEKKKSVKKPKSKWGRSYGF